MENKELAQYIDYTNLNPQASRKQIKTLVDGAIHYNFAGVCVANCWTSFVKNLLVNTAIKVITVPNFVTGGGIENVNKDDYCFELCDEIDYIWNIYNFGDLKNYDKIKEELKEIRKITKGKLKVIIESHYLRVSDEKVYKQGIEKIIKKACELLNECEIDFIKTDSGLFKRPEFETLLEDCKLMNKYKDKLKIKVAGGIKTKFQVEELIKTGADRVGTSNGVAIITSTV